MDPHLCSTRRRGKGICGYKCASLGLLGTILSFSGVAQAVDPFEIQVYDGTLDRVGVPGLELHLNTVPNGQKSAEAPELPLHHQSHFTLEPSLGVTPFWELGCYLQSALSSDGKWSYAGVKLRSKFVTPRTFSPNWRLGVNLEVSRIPQAFDRSRWGGEMRPIIAFENQSWLLAVNPILEFPLAGTNASSGPSFAPAAMVKYKLAELVALGVEYYADFGPLSAPDAVRDQQQYLFEALDLLAIERLELNMAVGEGFTNGSNGLVVKAIVGYSFDTSPLWTPSPARAEESGGAPSPASRPSAVTVRRATSSRSSPSSAPTPSLDRTAAPIANESRRETSNR